MDERVEDLSKDLPRLVQVFENAERFSGPSLHFHRRAIDTRRGLGSARAAIDSDQFVEFVYATLTAWGMHRMGPGNTKLREFEVVCGSLRSNRDTIGALDGLSLSQLAQAQLDTVASQAWKLVDALTISIAEAKIVANTKALHHVLPDLIPPIDRTYTFNFFYSRAMLSISEEEAFHEMFSRFHRIAAQNAVALRRLLGPGWNTSETKVLDNAVVGYAIDALNVLAE
jgi:hypothetical protein